MEHRTHWVVASENTTKQFAPESAQCRSAINSTMLASSRELEWTSLLLDHHRIEPDDTTFETRATPDQTIVVMVRGEQQLESFTHGMWRHATYHAGTVGLTPGGHVDRLRRRVGPRTRAFEKVNLYVPARVFAEAADHYRRAGSSVREPALNALAFADPLVAQAALALLDALACGAPDMYAESTAQWLATHLLLTHARCVKLAHAERTAGAMSDRRLARVLEMMSARSTESLTLAELAGEAGVSKFHFARLFRAKVGLTPHAVLARLRLEAVQTLLLGTDLDIKTIAARCGFTHASQLTTAFSRHFGMPPSRWRAAQRR